MFLSMTVYPDWTEIAQFLPVAVMSWFEYIHATLSPIFKTSWISSISPLEPHPTAIIVAENTVPEIFFDMIVIWLIKIIKSACPTLTKN